MAGSFITKTGILLQLKQKGGSQFSPASHQGTQHPRTGNLSWIIESTSLFNPPDQLIKNPGVLVMLCIVDCFKKNV